MVSLSALHIYPIKSCGGIDLAEAGISEQGLFMDRHWMLIDRDGRFLSQREHPLMATVKTALTGEALIVRARGMPQLSLPLAPAAAAAAVSASIWDYAVQPLDCGKQAHEWFSSYFGADARLVQFNPAERRICSQKWTGDALVATQFADGFPLLVANEASLEDLNQRMKKKGAPAIPMNRFRPNVVLSGLDAYEEDYVDTLTLGEPGSEIVLRMIKPCARCPVPGIDQETGRSSAEWPGEPLDTMATYRANDRVDGGLTFGQNAIVVRGQGNLLRVGQEAQVELNF
ncbi:MOSC domain-containing protein [Herbaspirillum rhizosphaerae]|uniref:MOSC domain-containing protein n=1 Tax=Herbaspirillum rhizosphaerae TaxID=346179 RepID=UPI00067AA15E|nr:MOSC N-terminal beta barrel domain-containing protein [Herbaspirillum rhizosphaerae]